jgi:hypothetical protein
MQPCYPESPTAATYDGRDPSNGIIASSDVPLPTRLEIRNCPPSASTLSTYAMSPDPLCGSAPPIPSSEIERRKFGPSAWTSTVTTRLDQIVVPTIWPMP